MKTRLLIRKFILSASIAFLLLSSTPFARAELSPFPEVELNVAPDEVAVREHALMLDEVPAEIKRLIQSHQTKIKINLAEGDYFIDQTISLTAENSPPEGGYVNWVAAPGKHVRLLGAKQMSKFSQANRNIEVLNLPLLGVKNWGHIEPQGFGLPVRPRPSEVFFNGKPLQVARTPHSGWLTIKDIPAGEKGNLVKVSGINLKTIARELAGGAELWFYGYWGVNWADQYIRIKSVNLKTDVITLDTPLSVYGMKKDQRVVLLNSFSQLDSPGEYQIDHIGNLFVWPPGPSLVNDVLVSLTDEPLFTLNEASHQHFSGIEFGYTRASALKISGGEDVTLESCQIRNTGNEGINIQGGTHHQILSSRFMDTGNEAILMDGGNRVTLESSHFIVSNNEFTRFGRIGRTNHPAIYTFGVGSTISHNEFSDAPHMAIRYDGNNHLIEYNHIHHVVQETSDAGAIYIGRDWAMRGNVIRYNYLHDIGDMKAPPPGVMGIYLDDLASGTEIYQNIITKTGRGVMVGGGRDNLIHDNLIANTNDAVFVDRRGKTWKVDFMNSPLNFLKNLQKVNFDAGIYRKQYPKLATILTQDPLEALGNEIRKNIFVHTSVSLNETKTLERENQSISKASTDLAPLAAALKIPASTIGILPTSERKNLLNTFGK